MKLGLTAFRDAKTVSGTFHEYEWTDLCDLLEKPTGKFVVNGSGDPDERKKYLPLLALRDFQGNTREKGSPGPTLVYGIEGDYDAEKVPMHLAAEGLAMMGWSGLFYSTAKHTAEKPRWRVVVPLTAPAPIEHRAALVRRLDKVMGDILGRESYDPRRCYFVGKLAESDYQTLRVEGEPMEASVSPAEIAEAAAYLPAEKNAPAPAGEAAYPSTDPLLKALSAAGMLGRYNGGAEWNVACPNGDDHSDGRGLGRDDSTVVYAYQGARYGFKCQHDHCAGPSPKCKDAKLVKLTDLINAADAQDAITTFRAQRVFAQRELARKIGEGIEEVPTEFPELLLEEMLEQFVFIGDGSRVVRRGYRGASLTFADFQKATKASHDFNAKGQPVSRANKWLAHSKRRYAHTVTFRPGAGEFTQDPDGAPALNLWHPRPFKAPENWRVLVQPFLSHVEYLVPIEAEREEFLHWLAHIEQFPGVLPSTHYLMITKMTGIGRNWLASGLARVWGGHTALNLDLVAMLDGGFNGRLARKVFAVVDELLEGVGRAQDKARRADKLKSMLTEETRAINPKYGHQHIEFNCCRFLMFSNHDAALPLGREDRRVLVIANPTRREDPDYYSHLFSLLDDPVFITSIREFLRTRDISAYNPSKPAEMNAAKQRVIAAGESDLVASVRDVMDTWPSDMISASTLKARVTEFGEKVSGPVLNAAYSEAGLTAYPKKARVDERIERLWIIRNVDKWIGAWPNKAAAEAQAGERPGK